MAVPGILRPERARGMSRRRLLVHSNYSGPEFHPVLEDRTSAGGGKPPPHCGLIKGGVVHSPGPGRGKTLECCAFSKVALVCALTALPSVEARA